VPYYTTDNGYPGYRLWQRNSGGIAAAANQPANASPLYVPASSWVPIESVSAGPSRVYTFAFPTTNPDATPYVVQKPSLNRQNGEILFSTYTWMGGGAGEGFWGYWTDSSDPDASTPNQWYQWGFHNICQDPPYKGETVDDYHYQWTNSGYGP